MDIVHEECTISTSRSPPTHAGLQRDFGEAAAPGYVVRSGDVPLPLGQGATALPFGAL